MSVEQWYFPSQSKWVFFGRVVVVDTWDLQVRIPYPRHTWLLRNSWPLFSLFSSFQYSWPKTVFYVNFIADDWIRTADLWRWKRSLYQLDHHNHRPTFPIFFSNEKTIHIFANINFTVLYLFSLFALPSLNHKIKTQDWPRTSWLQS